MDGRPRSVLLAEDDPDITALITEYLELSGFVVFTARHGRHALALLDFVRPDVIVLDLMMPELDGLGFLRAYKKRSDATAPVIAISAFEDYLEAALELGAGAALLKPLDVEKLLQAVSNSSFRASTTSRPVLDEEARLRAVVQLQLDRPSPSHALDDFTQRVARIFDVPVCLVSMVTRDRQYWHAHCGLPQVLAAERGTAREDSFCTHAVVAKAALIVQDTQDSPLFADNPLVREHGLRFYVGIPLITRLGDALGTLCVLDFAPRSFSSFDLELLSVLARRVLAELEWRERRLRPGAPESTFRHLAWLDEELDVLGREAFVEGLQIQSLRAAEQRKPLALSILAYPREDLVAATDALKAAFPRALIGRLGHSRLGLLVPDLSSADGSKRAAASHGAHARWVDVPRLLGGIDSFLQQAEQHLGTEGLGNGLA